MRKNLLLTVLLTGIMGTAMAQKDSLEDMLDDIDAPKKKDFITATFKATRIISSSSVENLGQGTLDFRISHRFGLLNQGYENTFGLDGATTHLALDYGIKPWLMVGIAHSGFLKEDDGFAKVKLLRQVKHGMPITLSYMGSVSVQTTPAPTLPSVDSNKWFLSNRFYYTNQILIARKFSDAISIQIMPTLVHYNLVDSSKFSNNTFAIGIGGRIKLNKRIAITGEYFYRVTNADLTVAGEKTYNALSLGVDIETGGHVFQLMLSNSQGMTDRTYIAQTTSNWADGGIRFGFNISRIFTIVKPKEFRGKDADKW